MTMQALTSNARDQEKPELDDVVGAIASAAMFRSTDCHWFNRSDDSQVRACVDAADPDVRKTAFAIADYLHQQATDKAGTSLYLLSLALSPSGDGADLHGPDLVSDYDTTLCKVSLMRLTLKDLVVDLRVYGDGFCNLAFTLPNGNTFDPRSVQNAVNTIMHVDGMTRIDTAYRYPKIEDLSIAPLATLAYKLLLADACLGFESLDELRFTSDACLYTDIAYLCSLTVPELQDQFNGLLAETEDSPFADIDVQGMDRISLIYTIVDLNEYLSSDDDGDEEEEDESCDEEDVEDEYLFDRMDEADDEDENDDLDAGEPWEMADMRRLLVRGKYLSAEDCAAKSDAEVEELFNSIPAYSNR